MKESDIVDVVAAKIKGGRIEFRERAVLDGYWLECSYPSWNFDIYDYRIKPEPPNPREFWINVYPKHGTAYPYRSNAEALGNKDNTINGETIHVREVTE